MTSTTTLYLHDTPPDPMPTPPGDPLLPPVPQPVTPDGLPIEPIGEPTPIEQPAPMQDPPMVRPPMAMAMARRRSTSHWPCPSIPISRATALTERPPLGR